MDSVEYKMPWNGLGTDFSQYERPQNFAETYTNRFRNVTGGAERRPGMARFSTAVSGSPTLTRLHEHVSTTGTETLLASDDFGSIWRYNGSAWVEARTGGGFSRYISAQIEDKLIFVNGVDRNIYTENGGQSFNELKAIITRGVLAGGSNTTTVVDGDISNWIGATLVSNNDIVYNVTQGAYGIVTTVASAALTITAMGSAGVANGAGIATTGQNPVAGVDNYQLLDYVDLNIFSGGDGTRKDNVELCGTGSTTTVIAVSGMNFANSEIRLGDIVYNTTRGAIALVGSVSANINLQQAINGQIVGDSIAFFKSAMPIASWIHTHYGRGYMIDARNQQRVVITAPDDPEDVTTFAKTLDATSFSFGTQQPTGDILLTLGTFQSYFVAAGRKNIFIYKGNTPIQDTTSTTLNFEPIAAYPDGIASRFSMGLNGSDLLYIANDGLQAISIGNISNTTIHNNVAAPVRNEMSTLIEQTNTDDVQITFYPRRAWVINKMGDRCYVLNNNPSYNDAGQQIVAPAWHLFTGKWAQQNHYFVRRDGTLLACGANGLVYQMDSSAATDDGTVIPTDLTTAWLRLEEPQKTVRVKQGHYIKPVFESGGNLEYTITAVAGYEQASSDTILVSAGGGGQIGSFVIGTTQIGGASFAQAIKHPLSWRGEQVRLQFTTNTSASPDIITGFTLYGTVGGVI